MAAADDEQSRPEVTSDADLGALLDGLVGEARRDRGELIVWLLNRDFTVKQIGAPLTPMMLPANRVMGDDGVYVSARETSRLSGIELEVPFLRKTADPNHIGTAPCSLPNAQPIECQRLC
jgi:hypothetical protein